MKEEVGKRLKECRKALKLTQAEVAQVLGVAQPVYLRFEKGIYECSYEQLVKLANLFDVTIDFLLGRSGF
ncbi:MAG: helix-turn-helix transcriptional regulator [Clostridia bacterium]|nr:helix-turn-helix transcriptional regulator [Clostridia bacterium]